MSLPLLTRQVTRDSESINFYAFLEGVFIDQSIIVPVFFQILCCSHDNIEWHGQTLDFAVQFLGGLPPVSTLRHDDEQINVAMLS